MQAWYVPPTRLEIFARKEKIANEAGPAAVASPVN
jgi:hypothetical protein